MEETISLKEIFAVLRKRFSLIVLITVVATAISGIISYFILTPIYQSSTQILVNQSQAEQVVDVNQVRTNIELINTYNVIIKSPTILEKVISELNLDKTYEELNEQITVSNAENSQVVSITVEDPDPGLAVKIANATAAVFQEEIVDIMNVDNVSILSTAELGENPSPVSPKPMLNMAIAFVVGLMVGVGVAFLLEYLDNTIKTEQDVEQHLGLPVLGVIANIDDANTIGSKRTDTWPIDVRGEKLES